MKINKLKILLIAIFYSSLFLDAQCMEQVNDRIPIGSVIAFAGEISPHGWLLCDGREWSSRDYPELYKSIKTKYVPDQEELRVIRYNANEENVYKLFYVPDLRGRVIVGVDGNAGRVTSNNTLGASSGEERHKLIQSELPVSINNLINFNKGLAGGGHGGLDFVCCTDPYNSLKSVVIGNDQPHNNMQPYKVLNYIINTGEMNKGLSSNQDKKINQLEKEIENLKVSQQGCAKAWVVFNGSNPNTLNSYGVSSVVRNSIGNYTINFLTPFSSSDYCSSLSPTRADYALLACANNQTQQSFTFDTFKIVNWVSIDPVRISACFYGN